MREGERRWASAHHEQLPPQSGRKAHKSQAEKLLPSLFRAASLQRPLLLKPSVTLEDKGNMLTNRPAPESQTRIKEQADLELTDNEWITST